MRLEEDETKEAMLVADSDLLRLSSSQPVYHPDPTLLRCSGLILAAPLTSLLGCVTGDESTVRPLAGKKMHHRSTPLNPPPFLLERTVR